MRLILILLLTINLLNAKKIALLIGNSQYSFQPLANPLNDVDGIYQTLREIGFKKNDIKVLKNASQSEMKKALFKFEQKATSSDIALVYFSGHGMQVANTNYMFPANTTATKPIHLEGLVNLNMFIQSATSAKYGIVLVDACRNNPLVKYFQNGRDKGFVSKKGLGQVSPKMGQMVIGFATSAGATADDGNNGMSPYSKALSKNLKLNIDIRMALGEVGIDVFEATKNNDIPQNPILKSTVGRDIVCLTRSCEKQILTPLNSKPKVEIVEKIIYRDRPQNIISYIPKPIPVSNNVVIIDNLMYQNQLFSTTDKHNFDTQQEGSRVWRRQEEKANNYCKSLSIDSYTNWRLPTKRELEKLLTRKKNGKYNIRQEFVENMPPLNGRFPWASFWTSTENNSKTWVIHLNSGKEYWFDKNKTDAVYVLCVHI